MSDPDRDESAISYLDKYNEKPDSTSAVALRQPLPIVEVKKRHRSRSPDLSHRKRHRSRSPEDSAQSPGLMDVWEEEEESDIEDIPPVLINVPMLNGPLAFTEDALKVWGRAHIDNTERAVQFRHQLKEWKTTKHELRKVLTQAYEETRRLNQFVVSNVVTQDHIYSLHLQVKRTATRVREASKDIDQIISVALKQMALNVEAIKDFGTVLRAIPFDTLSIHDFYRSLRSFYIGLMERFVKRFGKNDPFIFNIAHAFEHFLFACDHLVELPEGKTQFTSMMASIIRDVYHIDLDELKGANREMLGLSAWNENEKSVVSGIGSSSGPVPALNKEEMDEVLKAVRDKVVKKRVSKEDARYEAKMDRMMSSLKEMDVDDEVGPKLKLALAKAMKKDEKEFRGGKLILKGDMKDEKH